MRPTIEVIGCDPALRNMGLARALVYLDDFSIEVGAIELIWTEKTQLKQVRKSSDYLVRARKLSTELARFAASAKLIFAEIPHGSQSASGSMSNGICVGVLANATRPVVEVQANETKLFSVGHKNASKLEIINWAFERYPLLKWLKHGASKHPFKLTADNEHLADAIAAIHAGVRTEGFKQAVAMLRSLAA